MKFNCRQSRRFLLIILLSVPLLAGGCAFLSKDVTESAAPEPKYVYNSDLSDSRAKALFHYSRFRLFGTEGRWPDAIAALEQAVLFDSDSLYLKFVLAKAYLHTEQVEQSIGLLKRILEIEPDHIAAHELLGDVHVYRKNFSLAVSHFRRAYDLDADRSSVPIKLGLALERDGRVDEAVVVFEQLLDKHPQSIVARLTLARIYLQTGRNELAAEAYLQILELNPGHQQAVLEYGRLLAESDAQSALDLYLSTLELNPRAAAVRQRLAEHYLTREEYRPALEQLKMVQGQYPDNLQIVGRVALIELELQHWIDAEKGFLRLLEAGSHIDQNRYYLAMALAGQNRLTEAMAELEAIDPQSAIHTDATLQRAYLSNKSGQAEIAVKILEAMLDEGQQRSEVYFYLAAFLDELDRHERALEVIQEGLSRHPEDLRLLYQLGVSYEKSGDSKTAAQTMDQIIALDENHADALNFLAYYQAENMIDIDLALSRAKKAYDIKPSGYIADTLGWVYFKLGRFNESRPLLEKAAEEFPEDAVIHEHLGDLYRAMELYGDSERSYRRSLELDPKADQVHDKLKLLDGERDR